MKSKTDFPCATGRLLIREFEASDREALIGFSRDPTQLQYMIFSLGTEKEIDDFLEFAQTKAREEKRAEWHLALEEKGKSGCIGSVALMIEKDSPSSAELGYWFKRSAWGKGYATEASRFMLHWGFKTVGLHRIWGKCHVDNSASAHVMEKLGMSLEGRMREHIWLRDHYRSSLLYSMLEHEYQG
ncbi:MAG: GNAT family N-acetyltransferase [Anaerolineales bacterium]